MDAPPPIVMIRMLFGGLVSRAIAAAAELGFADQLAEGPKSVEELAVATGSKPDMVYRLLRALAAVDVFVEEAPGRFANTALSGTLRSDVPGSMRPWSQWLHHDVHVRAWLALPHTIRTGECAFEHVHSDKLFDFMGKNPDLAQPFNDAMTSISTMAALQIANMFDFSPYGTIVDVGGGHGILISTILSVHKKSRGVLFDDPKVVAGATATLEASGVGDRLQVAGGNFFESVPPDADAYVLKSVLHDWNDENAMRILKSIARAAKPGAKLLLIEVVVPPGNDYHPSKFMDLETMVVLGGRERTEAEHRAMMKEAGFELRKVTPLTPAQFSILEADRV